MKIDVVLRKKTSKSSFPVTEQLRSFVENQGEELSCGTCMKARQKEGSNFCPIATMNELLEIVVKSDKLISYGWASLSF